MKVSEIIPPPPSNPLIELVERYRIPIAGGLVILLLIGAGQLIRQRVISHADSQNQALKDQIATLTAKLESQQSAAGESVGTSATPAEVTPPSSTVPVKANKTGRASVKTQSAQAATPVPHGPVNINTATAAQLDALPGIGPTYAKRIIEYRTAHGNFSSVEQLLNVKGIGPKTLAKFRAMISI